MSPRGPIARWTPELDALLIEHFPTMPLVSLSFLVGRTVPALKVRAHKLRLRRDPAISRATRQAAGIAGYAAAEKRRAGEPVLHKYTPQPPPPPTRPDLRETGPDALAYHKRRQRAAAEALVAHGVDEHSAALAAHAIATGRVPGVGFLR
jgi:hypothetical protein